MRKLLAALVVLSALPLLAQDEDWRNRSAPPDQVVVHTTSPPRGAFELTPFIGYRWGGTIYADTSNAFEEDVDVETSSAFGLTFGIPLGSTPMKLELMANRQSSKLETGSGLFEPEFEVADIDVTYLHVGLQVPFAYSQNVIPYGVFSMGLTDLDPQVRNLSSEQRFSTSFGAGVKVPVTPHIGFRFEGRGYFTFLGDESDNDYGCDYYCDYEYFNNFYQGEVSGGLVISF